MHIQNTKKYAKRWNIFVYSNSMDLYMLLIGRYFEYYRLFRYLFNTVCYQNPFWKSSTYKFNLYERQKFTIYQHFYNIT
jgi:hypothetical protein